MRRGRDFHGLGPLGEESASNERIYYGLDALGSVRFLVNGHRQVVGQYTYSPFGEPYQENGLAPLYRYAGEPWSSGAGLTDLRARHYDPAVGRFLTRDSFPGFLEMPQSLHPYVYAENNPVNLTDPSGRIVDPFTLGLLITAVGFFGGELALLGDRCGEGNCLRQSSFEDVLVWGSGGALIADTLGLAAAPYLVVSMTPEMMTSDELVQIEAARASRSWQNLAQRGIDQTTSESTVLPPLRMRNGSVPTGLKGASPGLRALFSQGTIRGNSIINIRNILLNASETPFTQGLARNKQGYLFINGYGQETVRIMYRNCGWDIRIQNFAGNYLDEFGDVNVSKIRAWYRGVFKMRSVLTDEIRSVLKKYQELQECIIVGIAFQDFGTTAHILFEYIWDESGRVRGNLEQFEPLCLSLHLVQEFHVQNDLTEGQVKEPQYTNWGQNEVALVRLEEDAIRLERYRNLGVPFHHLTCFWERRGQRIDIIFSEFELTRSVPNAGPIWSLPSADVPGDSQGR